MEWNDEMKNEQGLLLYYKFLSYCIQLGLTSYRDCSELLGAVIMFHLQNASKVLVAPMEELREDFVDMLNNASFVRDETSNESR